MRETRTRVSEDKLWTPGEVAKRMRVDPKTVTRWAAAGKIESIKTLGGHVRIPESAIIKMMKSDDTSPEDGVFVISVKDSQGRVVQEQLFSIRRGQIFEMRGNAVTYNVATGEPQSIVLPLTFKWIS